MANCNGTSDIGHMLRKSGVPVRIENGGEVTSTFGVFDEVDESLLTGDAAAELVGRVRALAVETGSLPGLEDGVTLEVDGTTFRVVSARLIEDGKLTEVIVAE